MIARKPIHLLTEEERKQVVKLKDMWLDIGVENKDETAEFVRIGDPVTLELGLPHDAQQPAPARPAMDDKTGLWIAMEALRRTRGKDLKCSLFAVSTVQEEIGLRGARTSAFRVDPHVGIAVDVDHATDCPTIDKKQEGDIALGNGPVIYRGPNMNPRVDRASASIRPKSASFPIKSPPSDRPPAPTPTRSRSAAPAVAAGLVEPAEPLHAQPGRDGVARRHRPRRRVAGAVRPLAQRRRRFHAVIP